MKNMKKRFSVMLVIVFMVLSGCSGVTVETSGPLTVLFSEMDERYIKKAASLFTEQTGIQVEYRMIPTFAAASEYEKEFEKLMLGDAADVVVMNGGFMSNCNIQKAEAAGAFEDLTSYFAADKDWNWENYDTNVIDLMKSGDSLCILPLYYNFWAMIGEKNLLAESGFDISACDTGLGLLREVGDYCERMEQDDTLPLLYPYNDGWYRCILEVMQENPLDYVKSEVNWKEDIREVIDAYAKIYPSDTAPDETRYTSIASQMKSDLQWIFDGKALFYGFTDHCAGTYYQALQMISSFGEPVILPMYSADGSGLTAELTDAAAISRISKNKDAAYAFIKCLLDDTVMVQEKTQAGDAMRYTELSTLPVNQNSLAELITIWGYTADKSYDAVGQSCEPLSKELCDTLYEFQGKINSVFIRTRSQDGSVIAFFKDYLDGKESWDAAFDKADDRLMIYISE